MKVLGLLFRTQPLQHGFARFSLVKHERRRGGRRGNGGQVGSARTAAELHTPPAAASRFSHQTPAFPNTPLVPELELSSTVLQTTPHLGTLPTAPHTGALLHRSDLR